MTQIKKRIYIHLYACQQRFGGYTGKDIEEIARQLGFNRKSVKRRVKKWSKTDPLFAKLKYIGRHSIPLTLEDIFILNQHLSHNISSRKQDLIIEINNNIITASAC